MLGARAGIRDGRDTLFWSARWLDSGVILADSANESDPDFNLLDSVADFTAGDDGWNLTKLNSLLPSDLVEQIIGRSAPKEGLGADTVVWGENHDGRFSIKSAYNLITDQSSQHVEINWEKVWRWNGPHRIKFFLWLATNERLLTNAERARRHISIVSACPRCGSESESVGHVLRDCQFAAETWLALRIQRWVTSADEAFSRDARCLNRKRPKLWEAIAWDPGPEDAVTVNTDGSFNPTSNKATTGGIIRSSDGCGLVAFTMNLGCCTITRAEIRGAISGLELAWAYGFRHVELQLDSQAAIAILLSPEDPLHQYMAEVLYFRELCGREWRVRTRHVHREANKAADFLASQ
ncbi:Putative ribonuclease H protein At1g65750 [Linum perenne]